MGTGQIELPEKLIPVFDGEADVRGSYGGRGSGKTRSFAKMTAVRGYIWSMAGREGILLCGRQYMNSLDESSLAEIKAAIRSEPWLDAHYDIGEKFVRTKCGRIEYKFAGLDRNISSVKSKSRVLLCWVDEAESVSNVAWQTLIPTLREEDSELWVTWNPENDDSATNMRFRDSTDPRTKIVELNWRDNPRFPAILERARLKDKAERPDMYDHVWEGAYLKNTEGDYYKRELVSVREQGRILRIPQLDIPVNSFWDIGNSDGCAVWFHQSVGMEDRFIGYYEAHGETLAHYARELQNRGYIYNKHFMPHDANHKRLSDTNKSVKDMMEDLGLRNIEIVPVITDLNAGIQVTRKHFPTAWFDESCKAGIKRLDNYRKKYNARDARWIDEPNKANGSSEAADAFRQWAQAKEAGNVTVHGSTQLYDSDYSAPDWRL